MANENSNDPSAGRPYYDKISADLKNLIARRVLIERNLAMTEEKIFNAETEYLENTPYGNMLTGFDNYIKGTSGSAAAGRRNRGVSENDRIFSQSSITFKPNLDSPAPSAQGTPSHAPTPVAGSFKESNSNHATPASGTPANKSGGGSKKSKKNTNAGDDSETDTRETKKVRTNFGASRK